MKKLFFLLIISFFSVAAFSQNSEAEELPVYLRFPTVPQFTLYNISDSIAFTREDLKKNTPTVFFVFSPDCDHCQHETENLKKNIKLFKNAQVVMVSYLPWQDIKKFYADYNIANYPQITMARDTKFFFPVFFKVRNLPSIFIYDKKGKFKKALEGSVKMSDIVSHF